MDVLDTFRSCLPPAQPDLAKSRFLYRKLCNNEGFTYIYVPSER